MSKEKKIPRYSLEKAGVFYTIIIFVIAFLYLRNVDPFLWVNGQAMFRSQLEIGYIGIALAISFLPIALLMIKKRRWDV